MFNNTIELKTEKITYKRKSERGIVLREYNNLFELSRRRCPTFMISLKTRGNVYFTKTTRKKDGVCYIPFSSLEKDDVYYLNYDSDWFMLVPVEIGEFCCKFFIRSISTKEMQKDIKNLELDLFIKFIALYVASISKARKLRDPSTGPSSHLTK